MPKLNKATAKAVEETEISEGFGALPEAVYEFQLNDVTVSDEPGASGFHYWTWVYEIPENAEEYAGRRFWNTTSLSPGAMGMPGGITQTFAAFGTSADTDTDELLGSHVLIHLGQEVQQKGKNKGKMQNTAIGIFPLDHDFGSEEPF